MPDFFIGDLLTGKRIVQLPPLAGSWSAGVNDAGSMSCTVSLRNPAVARLGLFNAAAVGKAFLAVADGDTILQAGPIWDHDWNRDSGKLTLRGAGLLSYFDHRAVLPVLSGRLPTDATTNTQYWAVDDGVVSGVVNATDTRRSLQGIIVGLLTQALSWPSGNVPLTLPSIIAGTSQRAYRGSDVASVLERVRELTQVVGGPEIRLTPQWLSDKTGISWVAEIGTPTVPLISSLQRAVFYVGNDKSSVTNLTVSVNGLKMGSQAFASGGRSTDKALVSVSTDPMLTAAGYPLLDLVDSSRSTVQILATLQTYSDELVGRGKLPTQVWKFTHNLSVQPFLSAFRAGDFAEVRVISDLYLPSKTEPYIMRITGRSGDAEGKTVNLTFEPIN